MKTKLTLYLFGICLLLWACSKDKEPTPYIPPAGTSVIPNTMQREGDPALGYDYLVNGSYMSSGVPYLTYILSIGEDNSNILGRTGDNAVVKYEYTAGDAFNGVRVVASNCLGCHASTINGEFVMGLGNAGFDATVDQSDAIATFSDGIEAFYGNPSPEWDAFDPFRKSLEATASHTVTAVRGVNSGDKSGITLAHHRDFATLEWSDLPIAPIPSTVVPSDVPPWWVFKKKNAMFYAGMGRGDLSKFLMSTSLLSMEGDSSTANAIDHQFPHIQAYLYSLEAPIYQETTDPELVEQGKTIFEDNCAKCHGTYGEEETFPNLLVSLDVVGTDPALSNVIMDEEYRYFADWINEGWFGTHENPAEWYTEGGYVAQPLDGIWATAPYLHNGSVPTLDDLLNSSQRPTYWKRSFDTSDYDHDKVGWNYSVESSKTDSETYDTTLPAYGNEGHYFGDFLSTSQRSALIEYLKTI